MHGTTGLNSLLCRVGEASCSLSLCPPLSLSLSLSLSVSAFRCGGLFFLSISFCPRVLFFWERGVFFVLLSRTAISSPGFELFDSLSGLMTGLRSICCVVYVRLSAVPLSLYVSLCLYRCDGVPANARCSLFSLCFSSCPESFDILMCSAFSGTGIFLPG